MATVRSRTEDSYSLGTEVFDAEVNARVTAMRAELAGVEELMRSAVKIDLAKVCSFLFLQALSPSTRNNQVHFLTDIVL